MRILPVGYLIRVSSKEGHSFLLCVAHALDTEGKFLVADFAEFITTYPSRGFNIPAGRSFTFQEELQTSARTSCLIPVDNENLYAWITDKMKETYGKDLKVEVEQIKE